MPRSVKPDDAQIYFKVSKQLEAIGGSDDEDDIDEYFDASFIRRTLSIPFAPMWTTGIDIITKFKNLSKGRKEYIVFYTVAHVGILYYHLERQMKFLIGHKNLITCISMDQTGRWLVSADKDDDHSIIVWNSEDCFPVCTMFNPHPPGGVAAVALSQDARYLVSIGYEEDTLVKFWLWTYGKDEADGTISINRKKCGNAVDVCFNSNETTHFAVTFIHAVVFFTWLNKELTHKICTVQKKKNYGQFTCSTYIPYSHECYSATSNGWVVMWGLFFSLIPYEQVRDNNNKIFIKAVRIQKQVIEHITYVDGCIVITGGKMGIRFYDLDLKLLYICHKDDVAPTIAAYFNLVERNYIIKDPEHFDTDRTDLKYVLQEEPEFKKSIAVFNEEVNREEEEREKPENVVAEKRLIGKYSLSPQLKEFNKLLSIMYHKESRHNLTCMKSISDLEKRNQEIEEEDRSDEYDEIYVKALEKDFTLLHAPFLVRDFMILTTEGECAYVDMLDNTVDKFVSTTFAYVSCMDTHSEKPYLVVGYVDGYVICFDYEKYAVLFKTRILYNQETEKNVITSIRYSPQGFYLVAGSVRGWLIFLNPVTMEFDKQKPFRYERVRIMDIIFSSDNQYLAYYDDEKAVTLMRRVFENDDSKWEFYGRCIAHALPITGILFCGANRLFTISEDKCLVEYYTTESEPGKLEIISRVTILQRGYPIAFTTYDVMNNEENIYFVVSTSQYKYVIINEHESSLERTYLGPVVGGAPVSQLMVLKCVWIIPNKDNRYLLFKAGKYLGIQLLPLSGNPYKQITIIGHSQNINHFKISNCGRFVFTYGSNDNVCIMWSIRHESVELLCENGGSQLVPYYCLVEGGKDGWLFREMIDLFYYVQILHQGEDYPFTRVVNNKIPTSEIPNLMRAVGYFPTEFELDNILYEVKSYYVIATEPEDEDEINENELNFEGFIKLYLNHRHVLSFSLKEVEWAFQVLGQDGKIEREQFIELMCSKGEQFTSFTLQHCLSILTHHTVDTEITRYGFTEMLPEALTSDYFISEILGVEDK